MLHSTTDDTYNHGPDAQGFRTCVVFVSESKFRLDRAMPHTVDFDTVSTVATSSSRLVRSRRQPSGSRPKKQAVGFKLSAGSLLYAGTYRLTSRLRADNRVFATSYASCMRSRWSMSGPKAFSMRKAMSGVSAALPWSRSDSVARRTLRISAAFFTGQTQLLDDLRFDQIARMGRVSHRHPTPPSGSRSGRYRRRCSSSRHR